MKFCLSVALEATMLCFFNIKYQNYALFLSVVVPVILALERPQPSELCVGLKIGVPGKRIQQSNRLAGWVWSDISINTVIYLSGWDIKTLSWLKIYVL